RIINETVALSAERCTAGQIEVRVDPLPADVLVDCREGQVSLILLNLLNNACEAIEHETERWVAISLEIDANTARISVTDSGPGIPAEIRPRIMEPFFTTKPFGKGTGLGLSVSRGLAEAQGGQLARDA